MEKPFVSVIMPVYNTSEYLRDAIDSIVSQSLKNIELIITDDGSTDSSPEIIREYAGRYEYISVITQINSGQAVARNVAIKIAKGDYIYFMDSDDILDTGALEACYRLASGQNLDMVMFDAGNFGSQSETMFAGFSYDRSAVLIKDKIYTGKESILLLLDNRLFRASPCLHFIRREVIADHTLRFYPGIIHEDELFTPFLYIYSDRTGYIPEKFFSRRIRANSTMSAKFSVKNLNAYYTVINEYRRFKTDDAIIILIIDKLVSNVVNGIAYQAGINMNLKKRAGILMFFIKHNCIPAVTLKNLLILIFPYVIKIKSIFK
jgi:glycosyltransferase involved in cell wall biosynthesis